MLAVREFATPRQQLWLRRCAHVTGHVCGLRRWRRRSYPWRIRKIKEFCHVRLSRIARGQAGKVEPRFNEFQDRGGIRNCVGNVMFLGERRNYDQGHAISCVNKIAGWAHGGGAYVAGFEINGLDTIGTGHWLRRHVIVKASEFIPGQDEHCIFPGRTLHKSVNQAGHVLRAQLDFCPGVTVV